MQDQSTSIPPIGVALARPTHPPNPVISHQEISVLVVAAQPTAVAWARRHAADILSRWGQSELEWAVCQVVSELVTNAVTATATPPDPDPVSPAAVRLTIRLLARRVLVEVFDTAPELPVPQVPSGDDEQGRGLRIVGAPATDHGTALGGKGGKTVWASFVRVSG
ncbi:anti-sigma regulatory factor (Ser/Thr protein kinase) [Catenulispora sp. GP43]|uniref:ATP-binding protein n=1 Tax=Catenulispora sp. GP43 TaxID=3156263 RepID=UPI003515DCC6